MHVLDGNMLSVVTVANLCLYVHAKHVFDGKPTGELLLPVSSSQVCLIWPLAPIARATYQ